MPVPNRLFDEIPGLGDAALRCLLGLFRLSFRFDPQEGQWTCPEEWFLRRDLQEETGLSGEGTRKGLSELAEKGWAEVDPRGLAHRWRLVASVPTRRYTYVPTTLLSRASELPTGAALRALLTVLRETWGWTQVESQVRDSAPTEAPSGPEEPPQQYDHRKWARLSYGALSEQTGRSETAVKGAVERLQQEGWLDRHRPNQGAFCYRIRPEALTPTPDRQPDGGRKTGAGCKPGAGCKADADSKQGTAQSPKRPQEGKPSPDSSPENTSSETAPTSELVGDLPTEWHPPPFTREFLERDKQGAREGQSSSSKEKTDDTAPPRRSPAVPEENKPRGDGPHAQSSQQGTGQGDIPEESPADFSDFSERKRALGQKLLNVGIWPDRARECLRRYTALRIEANFSLYRKRARNVENDGAWLCAAITDGYADLGSEGSSPDSNSTQGSQRAPGSTQRSGPRPTDFGPDSADNSPLDAPGAGASSPPAKPSHKQRVSPREKDALVHHYETISSDQFHRFRLGESPTEKQFLYFDPAVGGPEKPARMRGRNSQVALNGDS